MAKKTRMLFALLLALVMLVSAACTKSDSDTKDDKPSKKEDTAETTETTEATEPANDKNPLDNLFKDITIDEAVIYEKDGIKVTVTGYEDGWMGPEISFLVENESDKNVVVSSLGLTVNGYMMDMFGLYSDVAAGKKANDTISLSSSDLELCGIEVVSQLQFYVEVVDPDTYDTIATSDLITVNTSADDYEQVIDDSGKVIYDANGIRIIYKSITESDIFAGSINFFIENNSGQDISVYAQEMSLNGFMFDGSLWSDLRDGTVAMDSIVLFDLAEVNMESIDEIESIELSLRIINAESWVEIGKTDAITITVE